MTRLLSLVLVLCLLVLGTTVALARGTSILGFSVQDYFMPPVSCTTQTVQPVVYKDMLLLVYTCQGNRVVVRRLVPEVQVESPEVPPVACTTVQPGPINGKAWTCVNGGWVPPMQP